jgi:hypothetical protein
MTPLSKNLQEAAALLVEEARERFLEMGARMDYAVWEQERIEIDRLLRKASILLIGVGPRGDG